MSSVIRRFRRMRMSPVERVIDSLRHGEFKEAGKEAKRGINRFDGKELADNVMDKLSALDTKERRAFFNQLAQSPERLRDAVEQSDLYGRAVDAYEDLKEDQGIEIDLLKAIGLVAVICVVFKLLRRR